MTERCFTSVKSNLRLLWFCITTLSDWLKKLGPLSQTIRNKTKKIAFTKFEGLAVPESVQSQS